MLILAVFALSACDLLNGAPTVQPTSPVPTLDPRPIEIATTAPTLPEPTATSTRPEPTAIPTHTPIPPTATSTLFPEYQTHMLSDQTGAISINVPTTWTDQQTLPWLDDNGKTIGTTFMVSTDTDKFLALEAEGVAISVSKRLPIGYIELLDREVPNYLGICDDTYHTRWDIDTTNHRGKEADMNCHGSSYEWLSLMTLVNKSDPAAYVVRLVGFDMIPIFGEDFREMLMQFEIDPTLLP